MTQTDNIQTNLARLNAALSKTDIPLFRRTVSPSMNNMQWLKKVVLPTAPDNSELKRLLSMSAKELLSPYVSPRT